MRFTIYFLFAIIGYVSARPQVPLPIVPIGEPAFRVVPVIDREELRDDSGQYSLFYRSADGGSQSSYLVLKPNPNGHGHLVVIKGSYSYTSPEGTPVRVFYEADEKGFRHVNNPVVDTPIIAA